MRFAPNTQLYKYVLQAKIGGGNFGEVWLAKDLTLDTHVAVKILDESMAPAALSLQEAQVGNRLNHQNVVRVHYADIVQYNGEDFVLIAMDHHTNGSVINKLNSGNFIPTPSAITYAIDILRGLEYLHEQNLFHNDIKPSNVLVGSRGEAMLTDYGISILSPGLVPIAATNAYVLHRAPETAGTGIISVVTDVYQVGMTIFRLINGIGAISELEARVGSVEFERLKNVGKIPHADDYLPFVTNAVKSVIGKAMHFDPNKRYQSALEMRRALEKLKLFGYWDTEPNGDFFGVLGKYKYTLSVTRSLSGYEILANKEHIETARKTKVSKYCSRVKDQAAVDKIKKELMHAVVNGNI